MTAVVLGCDQWDLALAAVLGAGAVFVLSLAVVLLLYVIAERQAAAEERSS